MAPGLGLATATLAPSLASAAGPLAWPGLAGASDARDQVSIGYWLGSESLPSVERLSHSAESYFVDSCRERLEAFDEIEPRQADLVPAGELWSGDRRFARDGVAVTIHGLFPNDGRAAGRLPCFSISMVQGKDYGPHHPERFHAWSYLGHEQPEGGAGVRFTAPVLADRGLTLAFEMTEAATAGAEPERRELLTRFSLGQEIATPKLRRGLYLIAWRAAKARPLPSWRRFEVLASDAETAALSDARHDGLCFSRLALRRDREARPDLSYVLMSLDYARSTETAWL